MVLVESLARRWTLRDSSHPISARTSPTHKPCAWSSLVWKPGDDSVSLSERLLTFFTSRVDARPLAVARIVIGGAAFLRALVSYHLFDRA